MRRAAAAVLLCAAALAGGCGKESPPEVRVFAASSLTDVMKTLAADYEKETGTKVVLNCASSSTLAHQVVEGAPCDLFLSADEEWAAYVRDRYGPGRHASMLPFLENRVVLVQEKSRPLRAGTSLQGGLEGALRDPRDARIAMGDPDHVPAGRYARRGLEQAGLWGLVRGRVLAADSVRSALALVLRGEADMGFVYRTDALAAGGKVREVAEVPGVAAEYFVVFDAGSERGRRFAFRYLLGSRVPEAFRAAGFRIPGEDR